MVFDYSVWYEENKEKLSEKRKKRYVEDKTYRAAVRDRNADYRARVRKPRVRPVKDPWIEVDTYKSGEGVCEGKAYSVGRLAAALGRSVKTVRALEVAGKIPVEDLRSDKGVRVYTEEQIEFLVATLGLRPIKAYAARSFKGTVTFSDGRKEKLEFYPVSQYAIALGLSPTTVSNYERQGKLPPTPFRASYGYKVYTSEQIEAARVCGVDGRIDAAKLTDLWLKLGVYAATVVSDKVTIAQD